MTNKILVIGSINQDIVIECEKIPNPGETVFGDSLHFFSGGKGVNQAIAANNFSKNVTFVGKAGNDIFGNDLIKHFKNINLNATVEQFDNLPTGTAIINVESTGENAITLVKGANDGFVSSDLKILENYSKDDILLIQNEVNQNFNHRLIEKAHKKGLKIFFNPAPSYKVPINIINKCDFVIVNEHELEEVFRITDFNSINDIQHKLLQLSKEFKTEIILTIGKLGSIATYNNKVITNKGKEVKVVDTTGAGDCFCGVLVSGISNNLSMFDSLELANKAASISVTKLGANNSYPNSNDF
jgi:ribokinase